MTDTALDPSLDPALRATALIDADHPAVRGFAQAHGGGNDARGRAVSLYHAVRDGFRYDPYRIDLSPAGMRASAVVERGYGWCVPKAALLAAACRVLGIPARVGYADVRNHLSTERLRQALQTDLFYWHGYTDILLEGRWIKATPAFNIELTERFGLLPLEWDGREDSIYHAFDKAGNRHMEYVHQRGSFDDMPLAQIVADFHTHYPRLVTQDAALGGADFAADVERETR
jgi:transglutaminase-like putative cysteine protease